MAAYANACLKCPKTLWPILALAAVRIVMTHLVLLLRSASAA